MQRANWAAAPAAAGHHAVSGGARERCALASWPLARTVIAGGASRRLDACDNGAAAAGGGGSAAISIVQPTPQQQSMQSLLLPPAGEGACCPSTTVWQMMPTGTAAAYTGTLAENDIQIMSAREN